MLFLVLALAAAPSADDAHLLTELIGNAAQRKDVDVLTGEDVRRAVDLEAQRQTIGCSNDSCLAEVASALGARFVVYGALADIGDELILTINLFDSGGATSAGRTLLRGDNLKSVINQIDAAVKGLVDAAVPPGSATRTRLLVLDVELRNGASSPSAAAASSSSSSSASSSTPWLLIGGVGVAAVGAVGVGVGAVFDVVAVGLDAQGRDAATPQVKLAGLQQDRDNSRAVALVGYVGGAALVVVGGALAVVGALE